jgi:hypothetical protein
MKKNLWLKVRTSTALLLFILSFFIVIKPASAIPTEVILSIPETQRTILQKIQVYADKVWKKFGAKLVTTTVRNTLNRVALDAAKYVATAGEGQKPTFIVEDFGTYWKNIGDAAAGDFIDGLGDGWGVDLCQPSVDLQAKISLGLVQTLAPESPDCTLTNLVSNYSSAYEKYAAMTTGDFVKGVQVSFDPGGSELSGAFSLFGKTFATSTKAAEDAKDKSFITEGWLDVRNIAGKLKGTPGSAQEDLQNAKKAQIDSFSTLVGEPLVDAANTFLNQLAYEGFQRALRELNKLGKTSEPVDINKLKSSIVGSSFESLIQYGESVVSEKLASVIKPRFDVRSDYSVLSELAVCPDKENQGPTNCVIDDKFSQAISEKLTIGEALSKGYLHGDWLVSDGTNSESTYTLRSASILRKFRILPVGWEQAISTAAKNGYKVTLQDLISCFDGNGLFSSDFDKNNQSWCRGLVDPNWVLKAPLNSCAKQGPGSQILSSLVSKDENGNDAVSISRETEYCADDQTCIKEKADGSCEVYGYCNEEKRTWNFSSDSCEPVYNTCQTFTSATEKQTASFLENTLDYSTCDSNNSGCKQYSYKGVYASSTASISWNQAASIFLNNKALSCNSSSEGCTQLLRGKPGWSGVNYVMNSDFKLNSVGDSSSLGFSKFHWPIKNGMAKIVEDSGRHLFVDGASGVSLYSNNNENLLPKNLIPVEGWSYTLSADVRLDQGDKVVMSFGSDNFKSETSANDWVTLTATITDTNSLDFSIAGYGPGSVKYSIKNLHLSPNNYYIDYDTYGNYPVAEKLLPEYLESSCYNSASGSGDYTLKDNAPAVCSDFARKCNSSEVGCELFTSVKDTFKAAAKANINDYCDASCVGYDTYLAKKSYFYSSSADNLIPEKATSCSAEVSGCASFTNLDLAGQGGEKVEYYTRMKQCIKPDTASCGDFYSWDEAQLKVLSLKKDSNGDPYVIEADDCKDTYNLPISDPRYNPSCREFYNKSGRISYHDISNTVTCSDNCYTYRLNEKNEDKTQSESSCSGTDRSWDATKGVCYVCQSGGVWDSKQGACIYKAIPNEGATCSVSELGCREYNGKNGNNLKLVATYDFDFDVNDFYSTTNSGTVSQSQDSTVKGGKSLSVNNTIAVDATSFAENKAAYVAKFMAKASGPETIINLYFENKTGDKAFFGTDENNDQGNIIIKNDNQWHLYEVNLAELNHQIDSETLRIKTNNGFVIDNLIINEITDRYYLIKNSSDIPDVCYYDMDDNYQGSSYNLGCSQYKDRAKIVHNLHRFSELCQDSAVGCELMIQTNNNSSNYGYTVNLNSGNKDDACEPGSLGCVEVKGSQAIYAVFDASKQCNKADVGCSRFGYLKTIGNNSVWNDVFVKNLPDNYSDENKSPLCQASEVGCDTWTNSQGGASYFKTPGLNTCVFKNGNWYKSPARRCDANNDGKITDAEKNGLTCSTDKDCGTKKCVTDSNDYPCEVTYLKTIGLGGLNGRVSTPSKSVGLCNAESSGCSEYIDPVSRYVNNSLFNSIAEDIDKDGGYDKWTTTTLNGKTYYYQDVAVKPNKLYILDINGNIAAPVEIKATSTLRTLNELNNLSDPVDTISSSNSVMFYTGVNASVRVHRVDVTTDKVNPAASISIKESIINYQLEDNLDLSSCNGVVNTDKGCVLFNARTQSGSSGLLKNIFNAKNTLENGAPTTCSGVNCSANTVIKVSPDRVCSRWLSCQTYTEDPITKERTCYKMGECDQLNEKNECGNFLAVDNVMRDIKNSQNKNATGYSLLDNYYIGGMKEVGQNADAHFDFENASMALSCARNIDIPASSPLSSYTSTSCSFDKGINENLILSPKNSPTDYPAHGKGYLKVLNYYQISPGSPVSIYTNRDYYINYLVNTKNSSARAKLIITDEFGKVITSFVNNSTEGWSRKVEKFSVYEDGGKTSSKKIKIYLTSTAENLTTGYVYFDDINIEPVLQTGDNSYVAKDCRLYPSDDSLSCLSINSNVIKDGLYGYCLHYDQANPGVCLMWYPIDKISPITRVNQSAVGYSGKMPLYYCVEANGNFDLIEKRVLSPVLFDTFGNNATFDEGKHACLYLTEAGVWAKKGDGTFNVDRSDKIKEKALAVCPSGYRPIVAIGDYNGVSNPYMKVACAPKEADLIYKNKKSVTGMNSCDSLEYYDGFAIYNLFEKKAYFITDHASSITIEGGSISGKSVCEDILKEGLSEPWCSSEQSGVNEEANISGGVKIYDYNNPPSSEDELKEISGTDYDNNYKLSCNTFIKTVDEDGNNIAWADRVGRSSIFANETPTFFLNYSNLKLFGRNREDVPFGAAIIPGGYDWSSSDPVTFRNQSSKKNVETVFAGRPYGCSNTKGTGCLNIGQCDLDPSIYCIYSPIDSNLNKKSCSAAGAGSCISLWSTNPSIYSAISNINQIFGKNYGFVSYSKSPSGYAPSKTSYTFTDVVGSNSCVGSSRGSNICKILPKIMSQKVVRVYDGREIKPINNNIVIDQAGLYQLSFNTIIDKEQQPMKQIVIDWGDGSTQIITGLDNRPEVDAPHNFYHFYLKDPARHIEIKVVDNWDAYTCSPMSGSGWSSESKDCKVITGGI